MRLRALFILLLCSCTRGLELPSAAVLTVSAQFASAAPREKLTFTASGGAGGYVWGFAEGGQLSGTDATVSSAGVYQAGSQGSAQDVLQVTDAAGEKEQIHVSVGQRLTITPNSVLLAPGASQSFTATGGKPPYRFVLAGGSSSTTLDTAAGTFFAGTAGDTTAHVTVRDATNDALAKDVALVTIGAAVKIFAPGRDSLTPYGTIDLIATGGLPPYTYSLSGNSGGSIASLTGRYTAGPLGGASITDTVTVTDSLAQSASTDLHPGPPLALTLSGGDLHPGVPVQLSASGGKPPYTYALAPRGNRSGASVDPQTGVYVPGRNVLTHDVLQVTDATPGALAVATVNATPVGPLRLTGVTAVTSSQTADFDGDGIPEVFGVTNASGTVAVRVTNFAYTPPLTTTYNGLTGTFLAFDLNGDKRADLARLQSTSLQIYPANLDGSLGVELTYARSSNLGSGVAASASPTAGTLFFANGSSTLSPCGSSGGNIDRIDWTFGSNTPAAPACAVAASGNVSQLAAGDLDGDGNVDLAWISSGTTLNIRYGPTFAALGGGKDSFTIPSVSPNRTFAYSGGSLYTLVTSGSRTALLRVDDSASRTPVFTQVDPFPDSPALVNFAPFVYTLTDGPHTALVGWDNLTGTIYGVTSAFAPITTMPPPRPYVVRNVAPVDTSKKGYPDLAVSGTQITDLIVADDVLVFGRRPHVSQLGTHFGIGDFDGDGATDVIVTTNSPTVRVAYYAPDHGLALGPETALSVVPDQVRSGHFGGTNASDALLRVGTSLYLAEGNGDGTFAAPIQLQSSGGDTTYGTYGDLQELPDSSGPSDLLAQALTDGSYRVLHRVGGAQNVLNAQPPLTPPGVDGDFACVMLAIDLNGDGRADVLAACGASGSSVVVSYSLAPATGLRTFDTWQTVTTVPGDYVMDLEHVGDTGALATFLSADSTTLTFGRIAATSGNVAWLASTMPNVNAEQFVQTSAPGAAVTQILGIGIVAGTCTPVSIDATGLATAQPSFRCPKNVAAPLLPAKGAAPDLFFESTAESTLLVNAGDGTFP